MPYKDADRRRAAARKWRLLHRADRAAYMRRYRRSRSSGRSRGRPRSQTEEFGGQPLVTGVERSAHPLEGISDPPQGRQQRTEGLNPPMSDPAPGSEPQDVSFEGSGPQEILPAHAESGFDQADRFGSGIP